MIDKKIFKELLSRFNIEDIEREFVLHYTKSAGLTFENCNYLLEYFSAYQYNNNLRTLVSQLDFSSIKILENSLELLIPESDRKLNGAFFTPSYVVDYIIKEIQPSYYDSNIDLSCGCGAFLIGLVDYYKNKYGKSIKQTLKDNVFGADLLDYNVKRAKIILTVYALQNNEVLDDDDFNIICVDSLKHNWDRTFDNIVGNPPYVKFQDLSNIKRELLSSSWETTSRGTYNLFFAFFELGYNLLNSGKLGYITPNNYFTSLAGEPLREFFTKSQCVYKIVDFDAKKVFDVQTYTAITFLTKKKEKELLYDKIKANNSPFEFLENLSFSPNKLEDLNFKKWRLLKTCERANIHKIENIGEPISNLYDICVGVATLKDAVFFVDGFTFDGSYYYKKSSDGITYKIEKEIVKSVYKISDFKSQSEVTENRRKIICPYIFKGKTKLINEDEFKLKYPLCYKYLLSEKYILEARDKGKRTPQPFYAWGRTQGLSKFGVKLLTPTFSKFPRFLKIDEQDAYFTNGYGIFFKNTMSGLFDDTHSLSKIENIDIVQNILNSSIMNYYVTCTSVAIEGGYPCYQKNFIEKFSIPNFSNDEIFNIRSFKTQEEIDQFLIQKYQLNI